MEPEKIKVWITKYALTKGIIEAEGVVDTQFQNTVIICGCYQYYHGHDWHRTKENAWARAREMQYAKIKSLKKQIAKLEAMTF